MDGSQFATGDDTRWQDTYTRAHTHTHNYTEPQTPATQTEIHTQTRRHTQKQTNIQTDTRTSRTVTSKREHKKNAGRLSICGGVERVCRMSRDQCMEQQGSGQPPLQSLQSQSVHSLCVASHRWVQSTTRTQPQVRGRPRKPATDLPHTLRTAKQEHSKTSGWRKPSGAAEQPETCFGLPKSAQDMAIIKQTQPFTRPRYIHGGVCDCSHLPHTHTHTHTLTHTHTQSNAQLPTQKP